MIDSDLIIRLEVPESSDELGLLLTETWDAGENEVFSLVMYLLCA